MDVAGIAIPVRASGAQDAMSQLQGVETVWTKLQARVVTWNNAIELAQKGWELLHRAAEPIFRVLEETTRAADKDERSQAALGATLQSTGQRSDEYVGFLDEEAKALQRTTESSDEAVRGVEQQLIAFGALREELPKLTRATLDLAEGMGRDLSGAAFLMGKAVAGEFGTLSRYGVFVDDNRSKSEKLAQAVEQITERFGGQAATAAATFGGQLQVLANLWDDVLEAAGRAITQSPVIQQGLSDLRGEIEELAPAVDKWVGANRELIDQRFAAAVEFIREQVEQLPSRFESARQTVGGLYHDLVPVVAVLRDAAEATLELLAVLQRFDPQALSHMVEFLLLVKGAKAVGVGSLLSGALTAAPAVGARAVAAAAAPAVAAGTTAAAVEAAAVVGGSGVAAKFAAEMTTVIIPTLARFAGALGIALLALEAYRAAKLEPVTEKTDAPPTSERTLGTFVRETVSEHFEKQERQRFEQVGGTIVRTVEPEPAAEIERRRKARHDFEMHEFDSPNADLEFRRQAAGAATEIPTLQLRQQMRAAEAGFAPGTSTAPGAGLRSEPTVSSPIPPTQTIDVVQLRVREQRAEKDAGKELEDGEQRRTTLAEATVAAREREAKTADYQLATMRAQGELGGRFVEQARQVEAAQRAQLEAQQAVVREQLKAAEDPAVGDSAKAAKLHAELDALEAQKQQITVVREAERSVSEDRLRSSEVQVERLRFVAETQRETYQTLVAQNAPLAQQLEAYDSYQEKTRAVLEAEQQKLTLELSSSRALGEAPSQVAATRLELEKVEAQLRTNGDEAKKFNDQMVAQAAELRDSVLSPLEAYDRFQKDLSSRTRPGTPGSELLTPEVVRRLDVRSRGEVREQLGLPPGLDQAVERVKQLDEAAKRGLITWQDYQVGVQKVADEFNGLGDTSTRVLNDIYESTQGWGRQFTEAFVGAFEDGADGWRKAAKALVQDIQRIVVQEAITEPLVLQPIRSLIRTARGEPNTSPSALEELAHRTSAGVTAAAKESEAYGPRIEPASFQAPQSSVVNVDQLYTPSIEASQDLTQTAERTDSGFTKLVGDIGTGFDDLFRATGLSLEAAILPVVAFAATLAAGQPWWVAVISAVGSIAASVAGSYAGGLARGTTPASPAGAGVSQQTQVNFAAENYGDTFQYQGVDVGAYRTEVPIQRHEGGWAERSSSTAVDTFDRRTSEHVARYHDGGSVRTESSSSSASLVSSTATAERESNTNTNTTAVASERMERYHEGGTVRSDVGTNTASTQSSSSATSSSSAERSTERGSERSTDRASFSDREHEHVRYDQSSHAWVRDSERSRSDVRHFLDAEHRSESDRRSESSVERYHDGGFPASSSSSLKPGEVFAVLEVGELVVSRQLAPRLVDSVMHSEDVDPAVRADLGRVARYHDGGSVRPQGWAGQLPTASPRSVDVLPTAPRDLGEGGEDAAEPVEVYRVEVNPTIVLASPDPREAHSYIMRNMPLITAELAKSIDKGKQLAVTVGRRKRGG